MEKMNRYGKRMFLIGRETARDVMNALVFGPLSVRKETISEIPVLFERSIAELRTRFIDVSRVQSTIFHLTHKSHRD